MTERTSTSQIVLFDQIGQSVRTIVWALVAYFLGKAAIAQIPALAGQQTSVTLSFIGQAVFKFQVVIPYILGISFWGLWYKERKLRHQKVAYLQDRVQELEKHLDPNRSSSDLTIEGKTNPEDI